MGTRKSKRHWGWTYGLDEAKTIPVVFPVQRLHLLLLRAHEQTSSPWGKVQNTLTSISQGSLY